VAPLRDRPDAAAKATARKTTAPRAVSAGVFTALFALVGLFASACGGADTTTDAGGGGGAGSTAASSSEATPTSEAAEASALYFYPPVEGASLTFKNSGAVAGTTTVTVQKVTAGADGQTVTAAEVNHGAGTPVTVERTFLTSPGGSLRIDAAAFGASAPGFKVTASGDDVAIPAISELDSGKTSAGKTFVEFSSSSVGGRSDVTYSVTGIGFADVKVPAGEFRAYVVEFTADIKSSFASFNNTAKSTIRYWLVPGFGLVRQEATVGGQTLVTELSASSVAVG
jgi:hypothetical protein